MATGKKCPYCSGDGKKIIGRVAGNPSHLTFGYGERTFECRRCGEVFSVCYAIPPKGHRKDMPKPNDGILKVGFKEGVSGFADHVVLKASASVPEITTDAQPDVPCEPAESAQEDDAL